MDDHLILNGAFFLKILLVAVLLILSLLIKNISMKRNWQHKKLLLFLNPLIFGFMACDIFNSGIDKTEFFSFQFYGVLTMIILYGSTTNGLILKVKILKNMDPFKLQHLFLC